MSEEALKNELLRLYALLSDLWSICETHKSDKRAISTHFVSDRVANILNGMPAPKDLENDARERFVARFGGEMPQKDD